MTPLNLAHLQTWIGQETVTEDTISTVPARLMAATLDQTADVQDGDPLPPVWHWLYFHEATPASAVGPDGHAKRGGFLPPVPLPARMWAGGRLRFHRPLPIGTQAIKRSTIKSVTEKQGRSGQLCFVLVEHQIMVAGEVCLTEEQDLVYREARGPGTSPPIKPAPTGAEFSQTIHPNSVLLFRYSALTFNGHRIHYDVDYCREVEGYPGLVVHGPLIATLLLELFRQQCPAGTITGFEFRAVSPLFATTPFTLHGRRTDGGGQVWAANAEGGVAMRGRVEVG